MKINSSRILLILGLLILSFSLSGCEFLDNLRVKILTQGAKTIDSVTKKVDEIGGQIQKTKESVDQKINDVQNAAKEVQNAAGQVGKAIDAVKKVTGGETGTTTVTGTSSSTNEPAAGSPSLAGATTN